MMPSVQSVGAHDALVLGKAQQSYRRSLWYFIQDDNASCRAKLGITPFA
jgi:hypothetical protein